MLIIESFRNFANSTYNREGAYNRVTRVHIFLNEKEIYVFLEDFIHIFPIMVRILETDAKKSELVF